MGDFIQAIGNGIVGLVSGSFQAIGSVLRGIVASLNSALPGGLLFVVVFAVLLVGAWTLAKR
jgi:hypothetical protein